MSDLKSAVSTLATTFTEQMAKEQAGFSMSMDVVFGERGTDGVRGPGLVVAKNQEICPIWGDKLPYKSVTVVIPELMLHDGLQHQVEYWLEYVHGGGSVSRRRSLPDGTVAIRSDYMAW
jgi:hypothetical protein